ncbi:hypothetical protein D3C81_1915690 [compost metagenome]
MEAAVPVFLTAAVNVIASVSTGAAGVHDIAVTVRSGLAAGVPIIWNSATCPALEPELAVIFN